jgi:predicted helicase
MRMKSIHDVLDELRDASFDERHKGDLFESLTKKFLEIDPFYGTYFDKVWLYGDWATETKISKQDTGIDLIARIAETGEIAAIQCKFYAEGAYLDKKEIDSFFTASGKEPFRERYIFSTTDNWSKNASDAVEGQQIPTTIIRVQDLDESGIDWSGFSLQEVSNIGLLKKKTPFPHQLEAIEAAKAHFVSSDRGKMIMACGTGKTFTALQIAQQMTPKGGTVLFLVPSLALLSQTLKEWKREASINFRAYAVCSDSKLSKQASTEDTRVADLAYPSTTSVDKLASHFNKGTDAELTVIFSTYQSIEVVAEAQKKGLPTFDLIICDEAHRTTGITLDGDDESTFVRVHDNTFLKGSKRLYMTATPRIYSDSSKAKAEEAKAVPVSMNNEEQFGQEFHRLNFGNAVSRGLLSDYKVLVLTVSETQVSKSLQKILTDGDELKLQDAIKIVGCYNGLRKRSTDPEDFLADKTPMRTAVAFSRSIKDSKRIADLFGTVTQALNDEANEKNGLIAEADHVDGTFNVMARNERLDWLKDTKTENTVRILSNARCLSEGVDVPALDAVLFLNPRDSQVDVVQSVGRVMRKAEGKQYGYVILPIAVPAGKSAEEALSDSKNYKVVWQVLQALRAHDERFDALVNKIDLTGNTGGVIEIIDASPRTSDDEWEGDSKSKEYVQESLFDFDFTDWKDAILAKIVQKVGERPYWENWAKDVTEIATTQIARIQLLVDGSNPSLLAAFKRFVKSLQDNLNPFVTELEAIEMLAQHLITKPVFDALFQDYQFSEQNPVSIAMQRMVDALEKSNLNQHTEELEKFYESVRLRASGISDASAKQKIVKELYERFFKLAFAATSERLGIVYTPNEIVDFIISGSNFLLKREFGLGITDPNVHVLDPFTGTGTFIVRLLQSGLIKPQDLLRKYKSELHANEIVLLAYYVAAINIEETFHSLVGGDYVSFDGIVLTDSFQMHEKDDSDELYGLEVFPENNHRVKAQKDTPIQIIIGNPPYSAGQTSANDANGNLSYPTLDARITETYALRTEAQNKNNLYDSYIRAIRWASDRIVGDGLVAYVTNNGFIDSNTASGLRKCLVDEFSDIYVVNYRGNSRMAGEAAKEEGGNIFDIRVGVSVIFLVKKAGIRNQGVIKYFAFPDYTTKSEKFEQTTNFETLDQIPWSVIEPNSSGDWINQRNQIFDSFISIGSKAKTKELSIFKSYSTGLQTNRDAWVYNFSTKRVEESTRKLLETYNSEVDRWISSGKNSKVEDFIEKNPKLISWSSSLLANFERCKHIDFKEDSVIDASYRPFSKQRLYADPEVLHRPAILRRDFARNDGKQFGFVLSGVGAAVPFSALMTKLVPDMSAFGAQTNSQFFPRFNFAQSEDESSQDSLSLFADESDDNISEESIQHFSNLLGIAVTADDVFYYTYAILNHPEYKVLFQNDLKRMLPRIPVLASFRQMSDAGKRLSDLHADYELVEPFPLVKTGKDISDLSVEKLSYKKSGKVVDKTSIIFNHNLVVSGIPLKAHEFKIGTKSAIDWVVERYQVSVDKASNLRNDPNEWAEEAGNPGYVLDLLSKVVTVAIETQELLEGLPALELE